MDDAPRGNLVLHETLTIFAQLIDAERRTAFGAHVSEVTLYFEVIRDAAVFLNCVGVDSGFCEFVDVVDNETCIQSEAAYQLTLRRTTTSVHQSKVNISAK